MTEKWTPEDEERLRRALHDEAARVVPSPGGLDRILARTRRSRRWRLPLPGPAVLGVAAAAVTAIAVVGAGFAMLRGADDVITGGDVTATAPLTPSPEPAPEPDPETPAYTAPPEPTAEPEAEPPTAPPVEPPPSFSGAVPVYYVTDTSAGLRLAREWRRVDAVPSAPEGAVGLLFEPAPVPGYRTLWDPATEVRAVEVRDGAIKVDLSLPAGSEPVAAANVDLAVQQLVYTATAAVSLVGGDGSLPVRILVDGERVDQLAGADVSAALGRAAATDVRLLVQLNNPHEGQRVTSPVVVRGEAAVFEANVLWEIRQDGDVVAEGYATAAEAFRFSPFEFSIDLPPGEYTIVVSEEDASGGEGRAPMSDARTFVVTD
jgi:hypothetical protein